MGMVRVYIRPFNDDGTISADYVDITKDVDANSIGSITQSLDNTDYDVGVLKNSRLSLKLVNDEGKYSSSNEVGSIFKFSRNNTLVRVTWEPGVGIYAGFFLAGAEDAIASEEITIFDGLVSDETSSEDIEQQLLMLNVLGLDSILDRVTVETADISDGDTFQEALFSILSKPEITRYLTIDIDNINLEVDSLVDDASVLHDQTVREVVADLLFAGNSVMYANMDGELIIKDRSPPAEVAFHFFGNASAEGIENLMQVDDYRSGLNRTFNFWLWDDTTLTSSDATSVQQNGAFKQSVNFEFVTNNTRRQTILDSLKEEFVNPKKELTVETPMTDASMALELLDRVDIDYPTIPFPSDEGNTAYYGVGSYGVDYYAQELSIFTINTLTNFKIIGKRVNLKAESIEFNLREI